MCVCVCVCMCVCVCACVCACVLRIVSTEKGSRVSVSNPIPHPHFLFSSLCTHCEWLQSPCLHPSALHQPGEDHIGGEQICWHWLQWMFRVLNVSVFCFVWGRAYLRFRVLPAVTTPPPHHTTSQLHTPPICRGKPAARRQLSYSQHFARKACLLSVLECFYFVLIFFNFFIELLFFFWWKVDFFVFLFFHHIFLLLKLLCCISAMACSPGWPHGLVDGWCCRGLPLWRRGQCQVGSVLCYIMFLRLGSAVHPTKSNGGLCNQLLYSETLLLRPH